MYSTGMLLPCQRALMQRDEHMIRRESFFKFLIAPPPGWTGIVVVLGVGVMGNLVAGLISLWSGDSAWQLGAWTLSILVFLVLAWVIYSTWRREEPKVLVSEDEQPAKYRGLIVLVGTGRPGEDPFSQSAWTAIEYHMMSRGQGAGLELCWLVASGGEKGSLPIAQKLKEKCEALSVRAHTAVVEDAFSVQACYEVVQRIYEENVPAAGLSEQEVIADITGGTSPMSAGMALACGDRRPMQYMYGRKKGVASVPRQMGFAAQVRRGQ